MKLFIRMLMLLACLACAATSPIPAYSAKPIKIGILAFPSKPLALAKWQPLAVVLKQAIPERDFEVAALNIPELDEAVAARQLDFVLTNSGHYVLLRNHGDLSAPLATLANTTGGQAFTAYGGVIFTRAGQAKINTLRDIKGKTVAAVDIKSQGAYQMQAYELSRIGIPPQDVKLFRTGLPQSQIVAAVLTGRADVGFVRSGVLENMVRQGKLDIKQLKILNRQELPDFPFQVSTRLYPEWPFAALLHVDENLARHVAVSLFELEENSAVTGAMGIHGFIVPADYIPVEEMLRRLRLPPFDATPRFTLQDVWTRYRWQNIGALFTGGVILLLGVSVLLMYRKLVANHHVVLLQKQKLQENEVKFRTVADYTFGWEIWEDSAGSCLYCSPACERVTGYTPDAFMADSGLLARLIHPDDLPKWQAHYAVMHDETKRREIAQKHTSELVFKILLADGEVRWIGHLCHHISDAEGHDLGMRISNRDVTERMQTSQALEEAELRFEAIFNAVMDGILVADTQTKTFVMGNSAICNMLGYQPEELIHLGIEDIHPAERFPEVLAQFERQEKGEIRLAPDLPIQRKDGSVFYADVSTTSMVLAERPLLVGIFHDVTERKQGEEKIRKLNNELEEKVRARTQQILDAREKLEAYVAEIKQTQQSLAESEAQLKTIFDSVKDGIILTDVESQRFRMVNSSFCNMLGYSRDELLNLGSAAIHPEEGLTYVLEQFERLAKGEIAIALNIPMRKKDGSIFYVDVNTGPMMYNGVACLVGVFRDITERKKAEEKIRQLNKSLNEKIQQLLAAQEDLMRKEKLALLGQVVGSVGHELRNPLAVMNNAVYFLQTVLADADETTWEYLEIIKDGVDDAERIVDDLLDSIRTKAPQPAAIGVGELLDQTLRTLNVPTTITVILDLPETLPQVWVDGRQIQQVFCNLIGNGVEAMPKGGTLAINAFENRLEGTVSVSVRDTGCGMPPEVQANLFQPLITTKARGIGLGLVVVKNLTEANGGTIMVESEVDQGTTFTVALPTSNPSKEVS